MPLFLGEPDPSLSPIIRWVEYRRLAQLTRENRDKALFRNDNESASVLWLDATRYDNLGDLALFHAFSLGSLQQQTQLTKKEIEKWHDRKVTQISLPLQPEVEKPQERQSWKSWLVALILLCVRWPLLRKRPPTKS